MKSVLQHQKSRYMWIIHKVLYCASLHQQHLTWFCFPCTTYLVCSTCIWRKYKHVSAAAAMYEGCSSVPIKRHVTYIHKLLFRSNWQLQWNRVNLSVPFLCGEINGIQYSWIRMAGAQNNILFCQWQAIHHSIDTCCRIVHKHDIFRSGSY